MEIQRTAESHTRKLAQAVVSAIRSALLPDQGMFLWSILSLITANGLWIGFPLYNRTIVLRHFHRKGWEQN
ncbi:MAG: hypothetical protein AB8B71_09275 [Paracoccaceae bacterium]